jgi:hypothetical protein
MSHQAFGGDVSRTVSPTTPVRNELSATALKPL